jgi:hypothetical protein
MSSQAFRFHVAAMQPRPIPQARAQRRHRLAPYLIAFVVAFSVTGCSATHQEVQASGDVLVRTGTTPIGWVAMFALMTFAAVFLSVFLVVFLGIAGGELIDSIRSRKFLQTIGWMISFPIVVGLIGLMALGLSANTFFKYQTTVITASRTTSELKVEQKRLIGSDLVRTWKYKDIAYIEFNYQPESGPSDSPTPPQGNVYVGGSDRTQYQVFDGSACPARKLAEAVTSATGVPIIVHSGYRDIASYESFLTQIRCGIQSPFHPTSWSQYPAEAWRVLDLPFLWRWPWALPIVAAQLVLVAATVTIIARWRASTCPTLVMVAVCALAGLAVVGMNVFATKSHGGWPGALALLALISARMVGRRLIPSESPGKSETPEPSESPGNSETPEPSESPGNGETSGRPTSDQS